MYVSVKKVYVLITLVNYNFIQELKLLHSIYKKQLSDNNIL